MESRRLIEATCPECRGPLTEIDNDGIVEYECLVGHRYSPHTVLEAHYEAQERSLWAAVVSLEESPNLVRAVERHLPADLTRELDGDAEQKQQQAQTIRKVLEELKPFRLR